MDDVFGDVEAAALLLKLQGGFLALEGGVDPFKLLGREALASIVDVDFVVSVGLESQPPVFRLARPGRFGGGLP